MEFVCIHSDELCHFGIQGQKWGKRNGPPYPLDYESHSSAEKRKNPKSVISGENQNEGNGEHKGLTSKQKKMIAIGAAVVGTALIAGGTYYAYKNSPEFQKLLKIGKRYVEKSTFDGGVITDIKDITNGNIQTESDIVENFFSANSSINSRKLGYDRNCMGCVVQRILYEKFGLKTSPMAAIKIDSKSGMVTQVGNLYNFNDLKDAFPEIDVKSMKFSSWDSLRNRLLQEFSNGSSGIIGLQNNDRSGGHAIQFDIIGKSVKFSDNQNASKFLKEALERGIDENLAKKTIFNTMSNIDNSILDKYFSLSDDIIFSRLDNVTKVSKEGLRKFVFSMN